jgi:hypothetical protein
MRKITRRLSILTLCLVAVSASAAAEEQPALLKSTCVQAPPLKGKSRQRFDSAAFMVVAAELESQGEKNFKLIFDPPSASCLVERVNLAGLETEAIYNPWVKGMQTLLYRFAAASSPETREVLVLYSGSVGLLVKGDYAFHVTETRDGVVSFYAMYKEEPTYPAARALAASIFSGTIKPLLAVRWPEGAKEGEVVAFDTTRLK